MAKKTTVEHLADLRKKLGYDKSATFINASRGKTKIFKSSKSMRKKLKHKTKQEIIESEKAFRKYCRKYIDPYILFHYDHYISDENKEDFRRNILRLMEIPSIKDTYKKYRIMNAKAKQERKAFNKYMKDKNPQTLEEYEKYEDKFNRKRDKMIKKYQKKGFVYTDNIFIKVDLDDFTDKLIQKHKEKEEINKRLLKAVEKGELIDIDNAPPHLQNITKVLNKVQKDIKKNTKVLRKGISQTDINSIVHF